MVLERAPASLLPGNIEADRLGVADVRIDVRAYDVNNVPVLTVSMFSLYHVVVVLFM